SETWNLTKQQTLKLRTMQRAHERIRQNITWRDHPRKNQSMRYHENNEQTQMRLDCSCGAKNRQPLDIPHYVLEAPGKLKEPGKTKEEMEGRLR
ncbi:unnamed protein product, partial [Porites evermanni]